VSIAVTFLRPMAQSLGRLGLDPEEFLRAAGIEPDASPDAYISTGRVEMALAQLGRRVGDPILGLHLAAASPVGCLGTFDYAVWASTSLREALSRTSRIYEFICRGAALEGDVRDDGYHLAVCTRPGLPPGHVLIDFTFGIHFVRFREALGEARLASVSFRHGVDDPKAYEAFFGVPPRFDQPADELVFDAALLDRKLRTADAQTSALLEAHALETIARLKPVDPFLHRLRAVVARRIRDGDLGLPSLAAEIGHSGRTLQRQLQDRGTSHREVVDAVRRELAIGMLADDRTSTVTVAHELGFASPQAFYRAFGRWTGMTPVEFRAVRLTGKARTG
jgi:AraC-like DNA-binding protein